MFDDGLLSILSYAAVVGVDEDRLHLLICKVLIYHFPDQLICSKLCHMILIIQGRRIYKPGYVCGFNHVTAVPHILEEVALSWCCGMFLLLACDDEKCCYRKYTAQHSKRLESQINYLALFECLIVTFVAGLQTFLSNVSNDMMQ